jgi:hypothetical protein
MVASAGGNSVSPTWARLWRLTGVRRRWGGTKRMRMEPTLVRRETMVDG